MSEINVYRPARVIAQAEARAFAELTVSLGKKISATKGVSSVGDRIAFLVIGALAIELYFKSFMISARGGRVIEGHELAVLYSNFPPFLKRCFEAEYSRRNAGATVEVVAVRASKEAPQRPSGDGPPYCFATFQDTVESLSKSFTAFRYLYESVGEKNWTHIPFPRQSVIAAIDTIESTYAELEGGELRGKAGLP